VINLTTHLQGIRNEHKIVVQWAANLEKDPTNTDQTSIFIGRLNSELVTPALLQQAFSKFGEIVDINLVLAQPPRPSFAFIKYTSDEDAQKAIESQNGIEWLGRFIRVKVKEINADHDMRQRSHSTDSTDTLFQTYQHMNQNTYQPMGRMPYQNQMQNPYMVPQVAQYTMNGYHIYTGVPNGFQGQPQYQPQPFVYGGEYQFDGQAPPAYPQMIPYRKPTLI